MSNLINEVGNKYGKLTVLERAESSNGSKEAHWKCKCECGNYVIVNGVNLRNGNTKSCGCLRGKVGKNALKDETGNRYGRLLVLSKGETKYGNIYWNCLCDCGKTISVNGYQLRSGRTQSCGCLRNEKVKQKKGPRKYNNFLVGAKDEIPLGQAKNLQGQRFGQLVALYRVANPSKTQNCAFWKCQCDCGNTTIVRSTALIAGRVTTCGQGHRKRILPDINPGERFGRLTVLHFIENINGHFLYACQCDCGSITKASASQLLHGTKISCGCIKSKGEYLISSLLTELKIPFIKEKSFKDCLGEKDLLRFDFYVNNQYIIEYDGEGHYFDGFGQESFEKTQKYDQIKNEYCKAHNIPLIRIPYWHYDKITIDDLRPETSQFLI